MLLAGIPVGLLLVGDTEERRSQLVLASMSGSVLGRLSRRVSAL